MTAAELLQIVQFIMSRENASHDAIQIALARVADIGTKRYDECQQRIYDLTEAVSLLKQARISSHEVRTEMPPWIALWFMASSVFVSLVSLYMAWRN